jgi:hypothetical protein
VERVAFLRPTYRRVVALNQTPIKPSGTVNVYALLRGNGSPTRHATAAAQAQRTDARSTIRTVTKDGVRQVKAEATVGSDAELAPRHLRCGNRRSAEQHRTDRRGHEAEQRADQSGLPTPTPTPETVRLALRESQAARSRSSNER